MKYIVFTLFFLINFTALFPQENIHRIELPIKYANDFEFIKNGHGKACLFLNRGEAYCIILLDSNFQVLEEFKDKYYTLKTPKFVGSIATGNRFELFFKLVEDDKLLVLILESDIKKLTRVKEFKISDKSKENIIFTGSTLNGNEMITIAHNQSRLIFKKHLPGLETENTFIQMNEEDYSVVKKSSCIAIESNADSLILLYKIEHKEEKNPYYKVFNIDINIGTYKTVDIVCDQNSHQRYLQAKLYKNTVMLGNCGTGLTLLDRLNGHLIKEITFDLDSSIINENLTIFKYSYNCSLNAFNNKEYYKYPSYESKYGLHYLYQNFDFFEDNTGLYLQLKNITYSNYSYCKTSTCLYLPFDWGNKEFITKLPLSQPRINDYIVYELDKRVNLKIDLTGYFFGFNNELLFGYLTKKSKEFIIEKPNF